MKQCVMCGVDISYKKSNNTKKCEKCVRKPNKNSLETIKKRTNGIKHIRIDLLHAYGAKCVICGWKIEQGILKNKYLHQRGCEIHHIISVSKGGKDTLENCLLLCPNHHKEADLGIITENELYSYIPKDIKEIIEQNKLKKLYESYNILSNVLDFNKS